MSKDLWALGKLGLVGQMGGRGGWRQGPEKTPNHSSAPVSCREQLGCIGNYMGEDAFCAHPSQAFTPDLSARRYSYSPSWQMGKMRSKEVEVICRRAKQGCEFRQGSNLSSQCLVPSSLVIPFARPIRAREGALGGEGEVPSIQ